MAKSLLNNVFRIAKGSLNFLSPSIIADILLHPFDFATVLIQIGFDPEGVKYETATLVSVILQYALFTFYIPYLLTSMQGLQFMGMPHPSIFYYVNFIYTKEGLIGCYRGLTAKVFERMIMLSVNEKFKRKFDKDEELHSRTYILNNETDAEKFVRTLINSLCSQFFAVIASHPFHVLMVSSFAEFTYNKNSSFFEMFRSIYIDDGCFGFFTGLTARLFGELLSLIFSLTYTNIINKQLARAQDPEEDTAPPLPQQRTASTIVNYVTDASRFTIFKESKSEEETNVDYSSEEEGNEPEDRTIFARSAVWFDVFMNFLRNITHHSSRGPTDSSTARNRRGYPILDYLPVTSKLFYYIMIRDFLSKKISYPFFLVSHSLIVHKNGWEKLPFRGYVYPLARFVEGQVQRKKRDVVHYNVNGIADM